MFTGIIEEVGQVASTGSARLTVDASLVLEGMKPGDSVAVNGVCLTVVSLDARSFSVDIMPETGKRTNLGRLHSGDAVNLERAMALGGRLGGHLVQGHIDGTGRITSITREGEACIIEIEAPPEVERYIVDKGFIAVDGISLTVVNREENSFSVSVVDYTRRHTNLGGKQAGDLVNLEADIIAKYVEQFTQSRRGITPEFLAAHGFNVG